MFRRIREPSGRRQGGVGEAHVSLIKRFGVSAAQWEKQVRMTSRRFTRELDLMAKMFAEARRRS